MAQALGTLSTISAAQAEIDTIPSIYTDVPDPPLVSEAKLRAPGEGLVPKRMGMISLNIETIIISALIFIGIFVWLEFIRTWFDHTFIDTTNFDLVYARFWYAIFITALVLVFLYIVVRSFRESRHRRHKDCD